MANEYKLSYTATQIDEKLGKIDSLVATVNGVSPDENGNVNIQVSGGNADYTDVSNIKTVLGNIMTIIKAQTDSEGGVERPQGYNMDVSSLVVQNDALIAALGGSGGGDTPDEPETEKTLTSISATYSGGSVTAGTAVSALTGIVVTAHYSDGTSEAVTGYTLSGTISEGNNIITVSYGGKTTTFTVTGSAESGGDEPAEMMDIITDVTWTDGIWLNAKGAETANASFSSSQFIPFEAGEVVTCTDWKGKNYKAIIVCYDADKNFLGSVETVYSDVGVDQYLTSVENTAYIRSTASTNILRSDPQFCKMLITAREV